METSLLTIKLAKFSSNLLVKLHLFRDLNCLENLFVIQEQIVLVQRCLKQPSIHLNSISHVSLFNYLRIRFYQILLTGAAFISFSRIYTQDGRSYLLNIALYNLAFIEGFSGPWNVWLGGFALLTVYYYQLAYFRTITEGNISRKWLKEVLIRPGKPVHFLWSNFEWPGFMQKKNKRSNVKEQCKSLPKITLVEHFRHSAVFVLNAFQLAFACNGINF